MLVTKKRRMIDAVDSVQLFFTKIRESLVASKKKKNQDAEVQPDTFCWKRQQGSQFRIPDDQHLSSLFVSSLGTGKELPINLPENKLKF